MSGQLRDLKNRIRSVENTKKITRAMEMVAAAKLHRFQTMMIQSRPYTDGLESLLRRLDQSRGGSRTAPTAIPSHPFFERREEKRIALVVITSDAGLCGSYNLDLINQALDFLTGRGGVPPPSEGRGNLAPAIEKILIGVGKAGINALRRRGFQFVDTVTEIRPNRFDEILGQIKTKTEQLYLEKKVDAVYAVYSRSLTLSSYKDVTVKLLPLAKPEEMTSNIDYLFEPSPALIFERLIPVYFEAKVRQIFLEAIVSEQIARMTAMHLATENAAEMIDSLVLERNKARQASITKEIIEIVSGSRALKK